MDAGLALTGTTAGAAVPRTMRYKGGTQKMHPTKNKRPNSTVFCQLAFKSCSNCSLKDFTIGPHYDLMKCELMDLKVYCIY